MTYTKEAFLKAASLAGISDIAAKYAVSLLEDTSYLIPPLSTNPSQLLEDICEVRGIPSSLVKTKDRTLKTVRIRLAFFEICKKEFPDAQIEEMAEVLVRGRCNFYRFYPEAIKNNPVIREYCTRTRDLLLVKAKKKLREGGIV